MRVHLRFSEKDRDLCRWRHSIKRNMLTYYICQMLRAEMQGDIAFIPDLKNVSVNTTPCDVFMKIDDPELSGFIMAIPEYSRNSRIKSVIRKHLKSQMFAVEPTFYENANSGTNFSQQKTSVKSETKREAIKEKTVPEKEHYTESEEDRAAILALIAMGGE